ncbi:MULTISPECIES: HNH endonuclease [unclassified Coleofasciculus]|uniref:HNH endonuclease n=1 Tax=unclassified Coleofasciculus TaxID=2692782 RepID=UPI001880DE15|nr:MULTISPECIES: HNH endonuclease [unclassified Coleofasciculus]MBE9130231.1 HNH endonuclease [Coleofasciculus sp. LEGE 07081]MBE9152530.1 HNH endonuclease [Coleofasciculus sp. LEGE 07092]
MTSATEVLMRSVVVFSKNYLPVSRVNIKRAIALLVTGKAEPLNFDGKGIAVRSPTLILLVPEHIRLTKTDRERVWRVPAVNRREVLRRDKHACQYCGSTKKLTLEHVIPRSKGGKHSWDNVVIACQRCNSRKGNRTPEQAGMTLRTKPKAPMHPAVAFAEEFWREQQVNLE